MDMIGIYLHFHDFYLASFCSFLDCYKTNIFKFLFCKYLIAILGDPFKVPSTPTHGMGMPILFVDVHFVSLRRTSLCQEKHMSYTKKNCAIQLYTKVWLSRL